jgi:hypothetical protein
MFAANGAGVGMGIGDIAFVDDALELTAIAVVLV